MLSTCGSPEEADSIALALVESRAAACVNILPGMRSVYRWKGAVESASEVLLLIKTQRRLFAEVEAVIRRTHSYELPEIVAIRIEGG
ncbi:MAG TPA: divalent-cation tolerance protein CutA, partial [Bryobacteraceae bacterium]|nr:divalent-cation tolerance protein CutA [Bryobacteraceae bacterium]